MTPKNRPPAYLPQTVRDHPAVIAACRERDLGKLFRVINNLTDAPTRFTASHIARRCAISPTRVADYMNGTHKAPTLSVIERVADGLHIPGARFALAARPWEPAALREGDTQNADIEPHGGIGAIIRTLRLSRGWSQDDLAAALNDALPGSTITRTEISRYESEARMPTATRIIDALSQALEAPEGDLRAAIRHSWTSRRAHRYGSPLRAWEKDASAQPMPPETPSSSNPLLLAARLRADLTQEECAEQLNALATHLAADGTISRPIAISLRHYRRWESNNPPWPRTDERTILERFFQLPITELGFSRGNNQIRAPRIARGWTQQQAADAVAQAVSKITKQGRAHGIDAQWIGRLERGEIRWPNADYRAALRTVYGAATDAELGLSGTRSQLSGSNPSTAEPRRHDPSYVAHATRTSDPRRNNLEDMLSAAAEEAADFGAWAEQMQTGAVMIERLHQRTRQLASGCLTRPPAEVMAQAGPLSRELFTLARQHHKPAQAHDLYVIATYLCSMMAWLAGDLGALDAAGLQARTAWACAEITDDAESAAWALSAQAKIAFQRKDYAKTVELTQRGLRYNSTGTSRLMLTCQQADALSLLGAADEALDSIRRADTEAERVRGADSIGGLLSCGPARHANYAAGVHLLIGQSDLALTCADRALDELNTSSAYGFGTVAQVYLTKTAAHIQAGHIDGAAEAARPVLDLPPERRLATITARLKPLANALNRPALRSSTAAVPLRTEIVEYCTTARTRQRELTGSSAESDT